MRDLFDDIEENPRIRRQPTKDWNNWLESSFSHGRCSCSRCKAHDFQEESYKHKHTFQFRHGYMTRVFGNSTSTDFAAKLKSSWVSLYDLKGDAINEFESKLTGKGVPLSKVEEFTVFSNTQYLKALLDAITGITLENDLIRMD